MPRNVRFGVRQEFGLQAAAGRQAENHLRIFDFGAINFSVGATENPCVGGSIPPLATTN